MKEGQQVRFVLRNGYRYQGTLLSETETSFFIVDKYNQRVEIKKEFVLLREEKK